MYSTNGLILFLCTALSTKLAVACEGECIVDITKAFLGNYSTPVHDVLAHIAADIADKLLPPSHRPTDPITIVQPIFTAYANASYDSLENAIFPSYFHGKCQRFSKDGQDPPGCPNPDCPVVCGTPGSLVHFYSTLKLIAFNDTRNLLESFVKPGTPTYREIEDLVKNEQHEQNSLPASESSSGSGNKGGSNAPSVFPELGIRSVSHGINHRNANWARRHTRAFNAVASSEESDLTKILANLGALLAQACGGDVEDSKSGLPDCSWETDMKAYILSFP